MQSSGTDFTCTFMNLYLFARQRIVKGIIPKNDIGYALVVVGIMRNA